MSDQQQNNPEMPDHQVPSLDELHTVHGLPPDASSAAAMQPWEQRADPGMGSGPGGSTASATGDATLSPDRVYEPASRHDLQRAIDQQTDLGSLARVDRHTTPQSDLAKQADTNSAIWHQFVSERLYDTRRVTLEHFHLFEWFPLTPGVYHTPEADSHRRNAFAMLERSADSQVYFSPGGKAMMVRGGIGAVRLRPKKMNGEEYYFMTASSSGVCHEGFPVLVPRRFYGPLKERILADGAVPVNLSGEMRYIADNDVTRFFGTRRDIPLLYLHVDTLALLPQPRSDVTRFVISIVVAFYGEVQGQRGPYMTFATFDPARSDSLTHSCDWLEQFYVAGLYQGTVITDFDEVQPRFPQAVFGLPELMAGRLDQARVRTLLVRAGLEEQRAERVQHFNTYISVGSITASQGIAIGPGAQADVRTMSTGGGEDGAGDGGASAAPS